MKIMETIHDLIEQEDFFHFSQDLYSTDTWSKIGSEILLRSNLGEPTSVFQNAEIVNRLYELEIKSISKALYSYSERNTPTELLFININPSTLLDADFPNFIQMVLSSYSSWARTIVFEILDTQKIQDIDSLKVAIEFLKDKGFYISIDDVGLGWTSLNIIKELKPHFIKLDPYFSVNLSKSFLKQEMIKSLLDYAQSNYVKIILEGVEKDTDLAFAKLLGIHICQGNILSRPRPLSL